MKFRLVIEPDKVDWVVFGLLLTSHLLNAYVGIFLLFVFFILRLAFSTRLFLPKPWKTIASYWALMGLVMMFSFFTHFSSFNNLFWGAISYAPIVLLPFVLSFGINKDYHSSDKLMNAVKLFTIIEFLVMAIQFTQIAFKYKTINIFAVTAGGAGDSIAGTAVGFSSVIAITLGFISILFLDTYVHSKRKQDLAWFVVTFIMMTLPGYTAGSLMYIVSFIIFFVGQFTSDLFKRWKIKKQIGIMVLLMVVGISLFVFTQFSNFWYAGKILTTIISIDPPVKIKAIQATKKYFNENVWDVPLGVGFGNYSSRAAFITGGEYLWFQPDYIPITRSAYFEKYMLPLYNKSTITQVIGNTAGSSMINAPFIQYQTIFGEGGIISLIILCILLVITFKTCLSSNTNLCSVGLLFFILLMFCDNWLSFPNFCLMFWLLLFFGSGKSLTHQKNSQQKTEVSFRTSAMIKNGSL